MKTFVRLVVLVASLALAAPTAFADEVLEAARKEKARREALAKKKGKPSEKEKTPPAVISNANLKKSGDGPSRLSTASGTAAQPDTGDGDAGKGDSTAAKDAKASGDGATPKKDDAYWKGELEKARAAVAEARSELQQANDRINVLRREVADLDDPNLQQARRAELTKAEGDLPKLRAKVAEAERGVERAREEARRGGASPGALR